MTLNRDTYDNKCKIRSNIVHGGLIINFERREQKFQRKWPNNHIEQGGSQTTQVFAIDQELKKDYFPFLSSEDIEFGKNLIEVSYSGFGFLFIK